MQATVMFLIIVVGDLLINVFLQEDTETFKEAHHKGGLMSPFWSLLARKSESR